MDAFATSREAPRGVSRAGPLDYPVLVARLQALQLATATARAGTRQEKVASGEGAQRAPVADIILGGQHWEQAVLVHGGSFNPAFACAARGA